MVFVLDRKFSNCATRLFADLCKIMQEKGAQTLGISGRPCFNLVRVFLSSCDLMQVVELIPRISPFFVPDPQGNFISLRAGPHRSKHVEHLACFCFVLGGGVSCDRKKGG